jgi:uncharacterized iron-regulated protein
MKNIITQLVILCFGVQLNAQVSLLDTSHHVIPNAEFAEKINSLDVLFFGEQHDDSLDHRMELILLCYLDSLKKGSVKLGLEMFETDQQLVLDEYLDGLVTDNDFKNQCQFWPNYSLDYHPLVKYARNSSMKVIGTNAPNRYAKMVYYYGDEYLLLVSKRAKKYFTIPDYFDSTLVSYADIKKYVPKGHNAKNILKAQVLKDATMANSILEHRDNKELFFHINGAYHSKNGEGVVWYLKAHKPKLRIGVITQIEGGYMYQEY